MGGIDLGLGLDSLAPACEDEGGDGKEQEGKTLAYTASGAPAVILSAAMRLRRRAACLLSLLLKLLCALPSYVWPQTNFLMRGENPFDPSFLHALLNVGMGIFLKFPMPLEKWVQNKSCLLSLQSCFVSVCVSILWLAMHTHSRARALFLWRLTFMTPTASSPSSLVAVACP